MPGQFDKNIKNIIEKYPSSLVRNQKQEVDNFFGTKKSSSKNIFGILQDVGFEITKAGKGSHVMCNIFRPGIGKNSRITLMVTRQKEGKRNRKTIGDVAEALDKLIEWTEKQEALLQKYFSSEKNSRSFP